MEDERRSKVGDKDYGGENGDDGNNRTDSPGERETGTGTSGKKRRIREGVPRGGRGRRRERRQKIRMERHGFIRISK